MAQEYLKGVMSSGEVVLIDTRQHWMAAVRFALKPIVLLIGVVLLALLNSWLSFDGALSFINDVVRFLLILAALVAVIWLPVDLVRWYSRHYVLTNRRAIRMQGVFRKQSFDSSLEQINDIAFSQSVLGRALGYADLTLYTASDTANESYEQLMDGLQFKKAVLDAKEAIRLSAPLTALPEGFIVKGGTNEASMRADGKLQTQSIDTTAAVQAEAQPVETAPPATEAKIAAYEPDPLARLDEDAAPTETEPASAEPSAPEPVAEPAVVADNETAPGTEPVPERATMPAPEPTPAPDPAEREPEADGEAEPPAEAPDASAAATEDEPAADEPAADEPAADEPAAEEPAEEEPAAEEPAADTPTTPPDEAPDPDKPAGSG